MPSYCPACEREITGLLYNCGYTEYGNENGVCDLEGEECEESNDESNGRDTEDYEYRCPECNEIIEIEDILQELPVTRGETHSATTPQTQQQRQTTEENNRIEKLLRTVECQNCHKINMRGINDTDDDKVIICENCNNEIII
jgi:predicted nucleic acid-binding Zn ribbon protein